MNNNAIKNGIREVLKMEEILIGKISFTKISQKSQRTFIDKIVLTLEDVCGVQLDTLKMRLDEYLSNLGIDYRTILLDI